MKKETSKPANRKVTKKNGKSRYTHAIYYRADGHRTPRELLQQAELAAAASSAKKAAKPAAKAKKTARKKQAMGKGSRKSQ
jgi:hypothetical protein